MVSSLLRAAFETYGQCSFYEDAGSVLGTFHMRDGEMQDHLFFETVFSRPDRFRYKFVDRASRGTYVVWTNAEQVRTWWSVRPKVSEFSSLETALGGPAGISGGSASAIPSLLVPFDSYESSWLWRYFGSADEVGHEMIKGIETVKLHVENPDGTFLERSLPEGIRKMVEGHGRSVPDLVRSRWKSRSLWIACVDQTVRRQEQQIDFGEHTTTTVITWKPRLDVSIDRHRFDFDPSLAK